MRVQNLHPKRQVKLVFVIKALKRLNWRHLNLPGGNRGFKANIFLTDDRSIAKLHSRFLGDERPTDVITFPCPLHSTTTPSGSRMGEEVAEIIISLNTAIRQARERRIPLQWELTLLSVHGLLHLSGCRDERLIDWKQMRIKEFETIVKIIS